MGDQVCQLNTSVFYARIVGMFNAGDSESVSSTDFVADMLWDELELGENKECDKEKILLGLSAKIWIVAFAPQHLVAILITGHMHNIISRTQFEKVRALVEIFDLGFPHWTTLESLSVFDNKCYSLSLGTLLSLVWNWLIQWLIQNWIFIQLNQMDF
ncbi:hypothetical protein VP01_2328g3, partial [Puccinia sorghi]